MNEIKAMLRLIWETCWPTLLLIVILCALLRLV